MNRPNRHFGIIKNAKYCIIDLDDYPKFKDAEVIAITTSKNESESPALVFIAQEILHTAQLIGHPKKTGPHGMTFRTISQGLILPGEDTGLHTLLENIKSRDEGGGPLHIFYVGERNCYVQLRSREDKKWTGEVMMQFKGKENKR